MKHEIKNVGRSCQYPIVFIRCTKRMSMRGNVTDFLFIIKKIFNWFKVLRYKYYHIEETVQKYGNYIDFTLYFQFYFFLTMIIRFS